MKASLVGLLLALTTFACGRHGNQTSAVQSIASTANQNLIDDLQKNKEDMKRDAATKEIKLSDVIARKEHYGLSDKEVKTIHEAFTQDEYSRLVLKIVDPNEMVGKAAPRWAFLPNVSDDADELRKIAVVDKNGPHGEIDGIEDPANINYPIITLGFTEKFEGAIPLKLADSAEPAADGALMLNSVEFSDVQEPWIKGAAEMYAVVSWIGKDGKGTSVLVEMPSVDDANVKYDLRQILHFWPQNRYQIANVAFFEHDSNYDYSALTKIFITAATTIVTSIIDPTQTTTIAIAGVVGQLAGKIVDALPAGTLTDDDDYVDTINTIEKYTPGFRSGVSSNVKADLSFYKVKINDE